MEKTIVIFYILINIITFSLYGIDKWKAKRHAWRIPEATLLGFAAIGGGLGALLGMSAFHHKTKHKKFTLTVPIMSTVQVILMVLYFIQR